MQMLICAFVDRVGKKTGFLITVILSNLTQIRHTLKFEYSEFKEIKTQWFKRKGFGSSFCQIHKLITGANVCMLSSHLNEISFIFS